MKYENIEEAKFLSRPNRFIAEIEVNGKTEVAHVKNTGRCKELLERGATIYVRADNNPNRKTKYDLISVYKGSRLVNIDSQIPNRVFREWVEKSGYFGEITLIKPEQKHGNSRFDFYMEAEGRKIFVEVKGVTLEENGAAMFPDAPTERGVKHVKELISAAEEGYRAALVFIIQMKGIEYFTPNDKTHPAFGHALREAAARGVEILALDCHIDKDTILAADFVQIKL
ncbi:DNA/RNA nuclease SfsA [Bacillota bacterium]